MTNNIAPSCGKITLPLRTQIIYGFLALTVLCLSILYDSRLLKIRDEPRHYPFMVLLDIQGGDGSVCGGTLIDQRRILTAAHCVNKAPWVIAILGTQTLDEIYDFFPLDKSRFLIREEFNETTYENDIALIYLDEDIPIDDKINVVPLPSEGSIPVDDKNTTQVVLGWALDGEDLNDNLLTKSVTILGKTICNVIKPNKDDNIICAFGTDDLKPCSGDVGGPILSGDTQIGILSGGAQKYTGFTVFTRIEKYLSWIQEHDLLT